MQIFSAFKKQKQKESKLMIIGQKLSFILEFRGESRLFWDAYFCKSKPLDTTYGIGVEEHDKEGRVISLKYEDFYYNVYTPNSQNELKRLDYRQRWDKCF